MKNYSIINEKYDYYGSLLLHEAFLLYYVEMEDFRGGDILNVESVMLCYEALEASFEVLLK